MIILASCAHRIDFKQPGNRFSTPETNGQGEVDINLGYGGSQNVSSLVIVDNWVTPFTTDVFFSSQTGQVEKASSFLVLADVGLFQWLDLEWGSYDDFTDLVYFKLQILGASYEKRAESGLRLAVRAGSSVGSSDKEEGGFYRTSSNSERIEWNATTEISNYEYGVLLGYRLSPWFLLYGHALENRRDVSVSGGDSLGEINSYLPLQDSGTTETFLIGAQLSTSSSFSLILEGGKSSTSYLEGDEVAHDFFGGSLQLSF